MLALFFMENPITESGDHSKAVEKYNVISNIEVLHEGVYLELR